MHITFDNYDEYNELFYAAREAQIRFKRLRTSITTMGNDTHWTVEDCDRNIQRFKDLEDLIATFEPTW